MPIGWSVGPKRPLRAIARGFAILLQGYTNPASMGRKNFRTSEFILGKNLFQRGRRKCKLFGLLQRNFCLGGVFFVNLLELPPCRTCRISVSYQLATINRNCRRA